MKRSQQQYQQQYQQSKSSIPPLIDGKHTLKEYVRLYRAGKVPAIAYVRVEIEPCHQCLQLRPDDGTPCSFCGVYKHCLTKPKGGLKTILREISAHEACAPSRGADRPPKPKLSKPVNPRRKTQHES